ncbi:MAG: exonuclease SbcCD subunit D, partial [Chloroflexota bacterium]
TELKILHFSDLHLGVETYGHVDPATGISSRLTDFLAALDRVVDYALDNGVDLVLFCGDAYKSREPGQTQQREFARRVNRLSTHDIPVFLLIGNHDLPNAIGKATSTEIFSTLAVKNVYVANRPDVYQIPTKKGLVQIAALPWPRRSVLLSREATKNLDFEQINQRIQQALTSIINGHASRLDPKLPSILAAHVWVSGAKLGSENTMTIGQEHVLLLSNLANPAFDYIALGHIHRHQVLSQSPPAVYAGSLQRLDFSDEGDEKGFYLVEIGEGEEPARRSVTYGFQPMSGRLFLTIDIDLKPEAVDPTVAVLQAITARQDEVKDAIVRVEISLPGELEGQLRYNDIKDALKEADYSTIAKDVKREARLRLGKSTVEEITPLEALKTYLQSKQEITPERAKVLLEYGERLIQEQVNK